jgi:hypothetical protein
LENLPRFGGEEITAGVCGVVAAKAFVVGVRFKDVGGLVGIVLEVRESIKQPLATFVNEEGGFDAGIGVAETSLDFGPALGAIGVGGTNRTERGKV